MQYAVLSLFCQKVLLKVNLATLRSMQLQNSTLDIVWYRGVDLKLLTALTTLLLYFRTTTATSCNCGVTVPLDVS